METKFSILLATLLVGGFGFPAVEDDMSIFFNKPVIDVGFRMLGSNDAAEGSWPWIVALVENKLVPVMYCGGSLLTNKHILTAAHCIVNSGGLLIARIGSNQWAFNGDTYTIQNNIVHPGHILDMHLNDIAILITSEYVKMNERVQTISLNTNVIGAGVSCRVAGWGSLTAQGPYPNNLKELGVNTIDTNTCFQEVAKFPHAPPVYPETQICTFHSALHGTCYGDSGGPLIDNSNQQIGVVSWGLPCAVGAPDMYVRVSAYLDWIHNNIL